MSLGSPLSIGALARATGVPVSTLRTWERRHGFPQSTRLPSGHRRYGQDQVEYIRWAHRAMQLGHKPSSLQSVGISALQALVQKAQQGPKLAHTRAPSQHIIPWLEHVERLDMVALERELLTGWSQHGAVGLSDHLIKPFLHALGHGWQTGRFTVAQEHAASECVGDFLAARWRALLSGSIGPAVVLATLPEEQHVLGLHQAAVVLSMHGYRPHFLGRGAPLPALLAAVEQLRPLALMLGISVSRSPRATHASLLELREKLEDRVQFVIGGRGAPMDIEGVLTLGSMAEVNSWALEHRLQEVA